MRIQEAHLQQDIAEIDRDIGTEVSHSEKKPKIIKRTGVLA
jgi:hypothetical protein